MKKQILITLISLLPVVSFARVAGFNEMIAENLKEQNQLHKAVQANVEAAREGAANENRQRVVIVESSGQSYNAPTRKDILAFKKEKKTIMPSEKKQFERLANEMDLSE